ncbi:hypothetical protein ABTL91_19285, partial [Acinetobacter baumannii]
SPHSLYAIRCKPAGLKQLTKFILLVDSIDIIHSLNNGRKRWIIAKMTTNHDSSQMYNDKLKP